MLKIENVEVFGWEAAIRGMRNPKNSWEKSDSNFSCRTCEGCVWEQDANVEEDEREKLSWCSHSPCRIGENDLKLMRTLANAGDDHGKVIRFLEVYVDITAPLYWWKEFRTYRRGKQFLDDGDDFLDPDALEMFIETNSCSTMHKIHAKEFELDDFSHEHLNEDVIHNPFNTIIDCLNFFRGLYLQHKDKNDWWQMIQLLPSSYNQKRTVKLNYQVLKNMYHARKTHKLDEWREFCRWVETLPYFKEICIRED
jgi:hypothetical protein